jgi:hypothetical protein
MAKKDTLGPAKTYDRKDKFYDVFSQAFEEFKYELNGLGNTRFQPIEQVDGITMRFLNKPNMQFSHKKYIVGNHQGMDLIDKSSPKEFFSILEKVLKKKFKELSGYTLEMKKEAEDNDIQFYSKLSANKTVLNGSYGQNMYRYMVTNSRVYSVTAKNLDTDDV